MRKEIVILLIIIGIGLTGSAGWAEQAYVTDSFEVTLRTGPSSENKIIGMPRSGQGLEVLEVKDNWSNVKWIKSNGDAQEGWILNRYLVSRQPWELQARSLMDENSSLKERLASIEDRAGEIGQTNQEVTKQLKSSNIELEKVISQYEALKKGASEYLALKDEHKKTIMALDTAERNVSNLTSELELLSNSQRNRWFATGALVLLFGLMIGVVVGSRQKRSRSSLY